jgi:HK97 family phage major capsid protein
MATLDINRFDAHALIPTQILEGVIQGVVENSVVLSTFRRLPNMATNKEKMAVLDVLPFAYWQTADTSLKKFTKTGWENKYIYAEEIAVIVPIAENVLNDANIDIWANITPLLVQAFGQKIDQAIILGDNKPASYRASLIDSIYNAGANIPASTNLYAEINDAMEKIEASGYDPTTIMGGTDMKAAFRMLLDSTGQPIKGTEIDSLPKKFVRNGIWDSKRAKFIVGDFSQAVFAIRQDMTIERSNQATLENPETGELIHLWQRDMVALRAVMRLGWEIPNPINALQPDHSVRFPFSLIEPSTPVTTYTVMFTVADADTTPIAGAKVTFGGIPKRTNASGTAVFKTQANETNSYTVTMEGKQKKRGTVAVVTSNVAVSVVLD